MKKLLTLAALFACVFCFTGCNDDEEDELKSVQYTLEAWFDRDFTGIYIHELDDKGDKLKTNTLYSLKRGETKTYTSEKGCTQVHIYAKCGGKYISEKENWLYDGEIILLNPASNITEDEYNFYTK